MKACGVEGTNQGLVAFTSQSILYMSFHAQGTDDGVRYSTV